jgi:two-component system, NtrC family, sensor kinase
MARLGVSKKKKSPRIAELSQLKKELQRLTEQLESSERERAEAMEQQAATSEILRVIASSPTDLQPVFQTILDNAVRLCEAQNGAVFRFDGEVFRAVAWNNISPEMEAFVQSTPIRPGRESALRRVGLEKRPVHILDMLADAECIVPEPYREEGMRTNLAVPLLKENDLIGAIAIHRGEVRPFTENQIRLLETFANQAVIAIENARLFQERETRNRDLAALHDVTAAASQSLEIKPVLDEVVKKITEIFAFDSVSIYLFDAQREHLNPVASFGTHEEAPLPRVFRRGSLAGRVAETGEPILFENLQTDPRYQELSQTKDAQQRDCCFFAIFPIKSKQRFLGTINCLGKQPRQLIVEEIRLIRSMCDQIGVAVENINLFEDVRNKTAALESSNSELREALEQQTATSEILRVIASSPTDLQPVLDVVAENAARLCGAGDAQVLRLDGNMLRLVAWFGSPAMPSERPMSRSYAAGRAVIDRKRSTSTTLPRRLLSFPRRPRLTMVFGRSLLRRCYARGSRSASLGLAERRSIRSQTNRSLFSKPSPIKR